MDVDKLVQGTFSMGMTEEQYRELLEDEAEIGPEEDVIFKTIGYQDRVINL